MSDQAENVAVVRAALETFKRGDMETFLDFLHPRIKTFSSPELVNPVEATGRDEWLRWVGEWLDAWETFEIDAEGMETVGDRHVIAAMRQRGKGRGSGVEVDMRVYYMFEIREGVATRYHLYPDRSDALAAAREGEAADA